MHIGRQGLNIFFLLKENSELCEPIIEREPQTYCSFKLLVCRD
jgi:hypothetical protein